MLEGSLTGTAILERGLQDSGKALILFFFLMTNSNATSSAQFLTTANHYLLTIQLYNFLKNNAGKFRLADHESQERYPE